MRFFVLLLSSLIACGDVNNNDREVNQQLVSRTGPDDDGDGYSQPYDCDDTDEDINPGEVEDPADGIDNDCDDAIDCEDDDADLTDSCYDGDADGWCDDTNGDGEIDVVFLCNPTDDANAATIASQTGGNPDLVVNYIVVEYEGDPMSGYSLPLPDCNDADAAISPGAEEVCDAGEVDEDCDGGANSADPDDSVSDPMWLYADIDGDTYGDPAVSDMACAASSGWVADDTDCDDARSDVNPGATEMCDSEDVDEDCDGWSDDADDSVSGQSTWYADADGDWFGDAGNSAMACDESSGWVADSTDCDDASSATYPDADETCANDGTDNDCDGASDDAASDEVTWYYDGDGDAYGLDSATVESCIAPGNFVGTGGDCDDTDDSVNPSAVETIDGVDEDCDGTVDDDAVGNLNIKVVGGVISSMSGSSSDDPTLDGEYYPTGVAGVSFSATYLGAGTYEYDLETDLAFSASGWFIVDAEFTDGSSLCDDPSAAYVLGTLDSTTLDVTNYDNGDGTCSYVFTRP